MRNLQRRRPDRPRVRVMRKSAAGGGGELDRSPAPCWPDRHSRRLLPPSGCDRGLARAGRAGRGDRTEAPRETPESPRVARDLIGGGAAEGMASGVTNQMPSQASFGRDRTVVYRRQGGVCRRVWDVQGRDTQEVAGKLRWLAEEDRAVRRIVVDDTGVGGGVTDRLREQPIRGGGVRVVAFQGGARPGDQARFANAVTEAWWTLAEALRAEDVDLDDNPALLAALSAGSVRTQGSLASARRIRGMVRGRGWRVPTGHPRPRRSGRGAPRSAPGGSAAGPVGGGSTSGPGPRAPIARTRPTACGSPCAGVSAIRSASGTSSSSCSSEATQSRTSRSAPGSAAAPRCSRIGGARSGAATPAAPGP